MISRQISFGYCDGGQPYAFTKCYNPVSKFAIRVFKAIPFLYEIKSVIDFSITKTGLDVFQWIKLEDAYITCFLIKAEMTSRKLTKKFGEPTQWYIKLSQGWCFLFGLIS